jgi:DNA-binding MarR family transcriptional regulator
VSVEPEVALKSDVPTLFYAVKQVEQVVRVRLEAVLRPYGITVVQYGALTVLQRRTRMTSSELARNAFVTPQSMAEMISTLEALGLIAREKDIADRRRLNIVLSSRGRELLQDCEADVAELEQVMLRDLSDHQIDVLRSALNSCRQSLT